MGRPRTPSNVLQLKGAFAKNPQRGAARDGEMEAIGDVGEPREEMSPSAQGCWREIKASLPEGALGRSDAIALELASGLLASIREEGIGNTAPAVLARLHALLGAMGMTPADRSKVKILKKGPGNAFDGIDGAA